MWIWVLRTEQREIARQFTDKIYDFPWMDDFAAARNFAFSKGTGEYLLWMDAEDILPLGGEGKAACFEGGFAGKSL